LGRFCQKLQEGLAYQNCKFITTEFNLDKEICLCVDRFGAFVAYKRCGLANLANELIFEFNVGDSIHNQSKTAKDFFLGVLQSTGTGEKTVLRNINFLFLLRNLCRQRWMTFQISANELVT